MKPTREPARNNQQTYFVSFQTANRQPLFRHERWLSLLMETVKRYATESLLHDYVVMEDHVHLLITPSGALERGVQLIKGGFSFQARRQFSWRAEILQRGFTDHRIRDCEDYEQHRGYILRNLQSLREPLRVQLERSGITSSLALARVPPRLKPPLNEREDGPAEAGPLQTHSGAFSAQNTL